MKIEASENLKIEIANFTKFIKDSEISEDLKKEVMKRAIILINVSSKESFIKGGEHIINKLKSQKGNLKNENNN